MIKERVRNRCVIRYPHYGKTVGLVNNLADEAKRDFPYLNKSDIQVVVFGGSRYKGTMGIEFDVQERDQNLEKYSEIGTLEFLLG